MAQPPSRLKVGPRDYVVQWTEEAYHEASLEAGKELEGTSSHAQEEIILRPGRSANWTADTMIHEALHSVISLHGVNLSNVKDLEDFEEYIVSIMSPLLLMVLRDNPEFVAFLLDPEVPWDLKSPPDPSPAAKPVPEKPVPRWPPDPN